MYNSLKLPWSMEPSPAEQAYRDAGLVKTKGTVYLVPPPQGILRDTFNAPPRPKSRMSSGANALCKHFERGGASSERGIAHPFWTLPTGSNDSKSAIASAIMEKMLREAVWKNIMMLHSGVAVYEIRNENAYGMRWTLHLTREDEQNAYGYTDRSQTREGDESSRQDDDLQGEQEGWRIKEVTFRGFVEPIEGLMLNGNGD